MLSLSRSIFICLILSFAASAQNSISVAISSCKEKEGDSYEMHDFSLFRNDTLIKSYETRVAKIIGELPDGDYAIEYKTIFGPRSEKFNLKYDAGKPDLHEFKLYIDKLSPETKAVTPGLFIDSLKNGEEIVVDHSYSGCFSSGKEALLIKKRDNNYYLAYKKKERKLDEKDMVALKVFDAELRNLKEASYTCTSNYHTTITYKGSFITFSEPCGYWEGYDRLKETFKLE
jgi:hypothetical protein